MLNSRLRVPMRVLLSSEKLNRRTAEAAISGRGEIAPICPLISWQAIDLIRPFQKRRYTYSWLGGATLPQVKPKARAAHENIHAL
jgi:hypothetical protein